MITKNQAIHLTIGETLYHVDNRNADRSAQRWRVNGKCKLWKTRPWDFKVPLKHGLHNHSYLTPETAHLLCLDETATEKMIDRS